MTKKKSIFEGALDIFEQGLASVKKLTGFLESTTHDKRTITSTQKAWNELTQGRTNKEVGEQLGISYQRVTIIKKKVSEGEAYSPELRDIAQEAVNTYNETPQKMDGGIYYFPNRDKLAKTVKHIDHIKTFPELSDAVAFWKKVIKSDKYIAIVKVKQKGKDFYQVVGLGKRTQRPKGPEHKIQDSRAKNRIDQLIEKHK